MSTAFELRDELDAANQAAIAAAPGCVPLHAAAIETAAGVIAIAGRSGAGKSTLCAAAVLAGYSYVADEITAVSPTDFSVRAFHRPIGLRRGGAAAVGVEYPDGPRYSIVYPWSVGRDATLSGGGALAGIVLVSWRADAEPAIVEVGAAQAMVELTQHIVVDGDDFTVPFAGLRRIVEAVGVVRMRYSSTAQSLDLLARLVERWTL